jgi:rhodanese-related sulfurtransferase
MRRIKTCLIVALLVIGLMITAFPVAFASPHTDINVATAWSMINSPLYPNLVILDVRNQSAFDTGYIPRAILIPLWQLQQRIGELSAYKNTEIIVHCKSGAMSHNATLILDANNFTKVYDMLGGIDAWKSSGYPIMKGVFQGYYRDWQVVLCEGRIYIVPPQTMAGVPKIQSPGTWDADYYGKLGWTIVDAARPAIDECIAGWRLWR